ncbi:beta-N-acetylglucosaminidase domain-containing protein [Rufibacter immobilis]|uniref:beta-N-acetylglucosaminidase domain-containing protein n=1 Tax=Rufibacter immobilis TaxID=1348778 RepID=UPI0035E47AFC
MLPQPQEAAIGSEGFVPAKPYRVTGLPASESSVLALLKAGLPMTQGGKALPLKVSKLSKKDSRLQRSGAYKLTVTPQKITIEAFDDRATFYAVQTLLQLTRQDKNGQVTLLPATVVDYPDVAYRGTVEGFYGEPWSHADRLVQLRFYGRLKLNTYIYGPKDDPYHSSPHWRDPYPAKEAAHIRELAQVAKQNKVEFVWAIHPGKDIQWNQADSAAVLAKFNLMYDLGVRAFAVFFDDISGVGTDAHMQANLLNYIQRHFNNQKKDVAPLIMCPTEYNKSWANKKEGTYLDILGHQLDPAIHVMWTGNRVVDDITKEGLEWVNRRIKRPAYVWWNFPVSDYVRNHLLMGPSYGLDQQATQNMSGFVSNPMDKAEASKPAIFSVALYSWNLKAYDPQKAWEASHAFVMPEAPAAFRTFSAHNSDPGPNGHRYRREESVTVQPHLTAFLEAYRAGKYPSEAGSVLSHEFTAIEKAGPEIKGKSRNQRLVEQIAPWLVQFNLLGKAGQHALQMAEHRANQKTAATWTEYLRVEAVLDSMVLVDATLNQNPYQPGVKTGALHLMPFIEELFGQTGLSFLNQQGGPGQPSKADALANVMYSKAVRFASQPLVFNNKGLSFSPMLETVYLDSAEYLGLKLGDAWQASMLSFNFSTNNLGTWSVFEVSPDAQSWSNVPVIEQRGKGTIAFSDPATRYVRFRNISAKRQNFFLKEFRLEVKPKGGQDPSLFAYDGSINTYQTLPGTQPVTVTLPAYLKGGPLTVLLRTEGSPFTITVPGKKGTGKILYRGSDSFVTLEANQLKNVSQLVFSTQATQPIRIYELVKGN